MSAEPDSSAGPDASPGLDSGPDAASEASGRRATSLRSVAVIGVFTLASRVAGLLREATRAHFLGVGPFADAFQVAFLIPNLFRRLVGEGAISSALVPVFSQYARDRSEADQRDFAEKFLSLWLPLVLVITLCGVFGAGWFVRGAFRWGGFGSNPEKLALTAELTSILFGYLFFVGVAAAFQGILNARNHYALPSLAPFLFNLSFIAIAWVYAPGTPGTRERSVVLAFAVLGGGAVQFGVQVWPLWHLGVRPRVRWPFRHEGVRRVLALFVPAVFGAGIYQINVLASTILAGRLEGDGAVSALGYSSRVLEVVLGVFVFALGTVSLTSLSRQAASGDDRAFARNLETVARLVLWITIPSAVGLYLLREPVFAFLLSSGQFDARALAFTSEAFRWHIIGLPCIGLGRIFVNAFYARRDVRTPVRVAALIFALNLGLAWWLSEGELSFGGISLAASLTALIQLGILAALLRRRVPLEMGGLWRMAAGASLATLAMSWPLGLLAPWLEAATGKVELGLRLGGTIGMAAIVFFGVCRVLGLEEARALGRALDRRGRG